jgi:hypothetical protein
MNDLEIQELLKDRETMPIYEESIFYPEKALYALGFTDVDIEDLCQFMRWHINQRNIGLERKNLVTVLRTRYAQLIIQRKSDLLRELESLKSISI